MKETTTGAVEYITPKKAQEYLARNTMNRKANKEIVAYYANMMSRGQWSLNGEPIIFASDGTLLDGQQRLLAIIKAGVGVHIFVVRGVSKSAMPTIDTGKVRNTSDVCAVAGIPDSVHMASMTIGMLSLRKGLHFIRGNSRASRKISNADVLEEIDANMDALREVLLTIARFYRKQGVLPRSEAASLCAWLILDKLHDKEHVFKFFEMLFTGDNITCPAVKMLREKLIYNQLHRIQMKGMDKEGLIAKTWNIYVKGSTSTRIQPKTGEKVEFI